MHTGDPSILAYVTYDRSSQTNLLLWQNTPLSQSDYILSCYTPSEREAEEVRGLE